MQLEDLQHIFQPQIDRGWSTVRFMLIENNLQHIHLHGADDLDSLVPQLDNFQHVESDVLTPRFVK
jgi:hypothetical protein